MELSYWDYSLILTFILLLLYYYGMKGFDHFKKSNVKHPKVLPFLGNAYKSLNMRTHIYKILDEVYDGYPDERYIGMYEFKRPMVWIKDPEIIKQIVVKDFDHFVDHRHMFSENMDSLFSNNLFALQGLKWKDMRATLSPAFTSSKMKAMFPLIVECSKQIINYMHKEVKTEVAKGREHYEVEIKDVFTRYANDVIASSAFGLNVDSMNDKTNEFYLMGKKITKYSSWAMIKMLLFMIFPKLMQFFKADFIQQDIANFFKSLVHQTMKRRTERKIVRHDLIHLLLQAKNNGHITNEENEETTITHKRVWSDDELVAQAFLFFLAGFETVSTCMTFAAYEIARRPDIQEKLKEEIDQTLENNDALTYEVISKMPYLDMFISETMRMWPPVIGVDRCCVKPYTLPPPNKDVDTTYQMNVGDCLFIPTRCLHRDPRYFPEPEKFIPERFSEENKSNIKPYTYMPFGEGPRACIGNRFALMEVKTILIQLLSKFTFETCSKTEDLAKANMKWYAVLPQNGVWIGVKLRE